jgi:hypothetical protein
MRRGACPERTRTGAGQNYERSGGNSTLPGFNSDLCVILERSEESRLFRRSSSSVESYLARYFTGEAASRSEAVRVLDLREDREPPSMLCSSLCHPDRSPRSGDPREAMLPLFPSFSPRHPERSRRISAKRCSFLFSLPSSGRSPRSGETPPIPSPSVGRGLG